MIPALRFLLPALFAALLGVQAGAALAQDFVPVPPLQTRVTDQIGMLTPQQRATLENVLKEYETKSGAQIAILLMSSTAPESIDQYSIRVADAWKLGRKGIDDGVLLIVARDNPPALRRLRIEAFRGVQGTLTDVQSKRIIDDLIAPHFRQNDYYGGLTAAVSAIVSLLEAEQLPRPEGQGQAQANGDEAGGDGFITFLIFAVFVLVMMRRGRRGRRLHRHAWGSSVPGVILGGAMGHGLGRRWGSRGYDGGFGGGLGGGFGGGGFGGGGFSGGGGGADGGGASGNW